MDAEPKDLEMTPFVDEDSTYDSTQVFPKRRKMNDRLIHGKFLFSIFTSSLFIFFTKGFRIWLFYVELTPNYLWPACLVGYFSLLSRMIIFHALLKKVPYRNVYLIYGIFTYGFFDSIDGPIARGTNSVSPFGGALDHSIIDATSYVYVWYLLTQCYVEHQLYWIIVLMRGSFEESQLVNVPRIPVPHPLIMIYVWIAILWRATTLEDFIIKKTENSRFAELALYIIKGYFAIIFLSYQLTDESNQWDGSHDQIRLDTWVQCHIFRDDHKCEELV